MHLWLAALRHDLLKRALWPARDGGSPEELRQGLRELIDDEGNEITAVALFERMRRDAPRGAEKACDTFAAALARADATLAPKDILALDPAFAALAREVEGK